VPVSPLCWCGVLCVVVVVADVFTHNTPTLTPTTPLTVLLQPTFSRSPPLAPHPRAPVCSLWTQLKPKVWRVGVLMGRCVWRGNVRCACWCVDLVTWPCQVCVGPCCLCPPLWARTMSSISLVWPLCIDVCGPCASTAGDFSLLSGTSGGTRLFEVKGNGLLTVSEGGLAVTGLSTIQGGMRVRR
jgi:hypothetical protein